MKINIKQLDDIKLKKYKAAVIDNLLLSVTYNKIQFVLLFRTSLSKKKIINFLVGNGTFRLKNEKSLFFKRADKCIENIRVYLSETNNKVIAISKDKG